MDRIAHRLAALIVLAARLASAQSAPEPTSTEKTVDEQKEDAEAIRDLALRDQAMVAPETLEAEYRMTYSLARGATPMGTVEQRTFTNQWILRIGATSNFNMNATIPYIGRYAVTTNSMGEQAGWRHGFGDVTLGAQYRLVPEAAHRPGVFANAGFGFPTGRSPFVSPQFATGAGAFTPSLGAVLVYSTDPVVLSAGATAGYGLPVDVFGKTGKPGVSVAGRLGMTMVLSEKFALNLAVMGSGGQDYRLGGQRLIGSRPEMYAFDIGGLIGFGRLNVSIDAQASLMGSGGVAMTVGVPYRY